MPTLYLTAQSRLTPSLHITAHKWAAKAYECPIGGGGDQITEPPYLNGSLGSDPPYPPYKFTNYCSKPLKAPYNEPPRPMARSKSKNKTLAVGERAHSLVSELQARLRLKNHDETVLYLLGLEAEKQQQQLLQ